MASGVSSVTRRTAPRVHSVYRDGRGTIHLDWPQSRVPEALEDTEGTLWLDIEDLDTEIVEVEALFRDVFKFHPLAIEDALQQANSPKLDDWGNNLYTLLHTIDFARRR